MYLPCGHTGYRLSIQGTLSAAGYGGQQHLALMLISELGAPHITL